MSGPSVCQRNKFGFCKFGTLCRNQHVDEKCNDEYCDIENCQKRHPKKCYFYGLYRMCKFGEFCRYEHEEVVDKKNDMKALMEEEAVKSSIKFQSIEKDINNLKNEIMKLTEENIILKRNLNDLQNNITQKTASEIVTEGNPFQCSDCDFISKSKSGLTTHVKRKHNIPQLDGSNNTTDDEGEIFYTIKVTFVSETMENAKHNLLNYYICDLTPVHSESLQFLEK